MSMIDRSKITDLRRRVVLGEANSDEFDALAELLIHSGMDSEAGAVLADGLARFPVRGSLLLMQAQLLAGQGRLQESRGMIDSAAQDQLVRPRALGMIGFQEQGVGRFAEAKTAFEGALRLEPTLGDLYLGWTQSNRFSKADQWLLDQLVQVIGSAEQDPEFLMPLFYARAKIESDLGHAEEAACFYHQANECAFQTNLDGRQFQLDRYRAGNDLVIRTLSGEFLSRHRKLGSDRKLPILVVGMMRSGTTLVEQVLSNHCEVGAAGELDFWLDTAPNLFDWSTGDLRKSEFARAIDDYTKVMRTLVPGKRRVTDKMPQNVQWLGLIHMAFPEARIIHVRRDPLDTCFSIYTTPYVQSPGFAHREGSILDAYREYARLMRHWESVIPASRLMTVQYEDVVQEPEGQIRKIIDFCGLAWDDRCLHPELNEGLIKTPSVWQARQSINAGSIGRSRRYLPWLNELAELAT